MARAEGEVSEREEGRRRMAKQQPFASVGDFVKFYFPDYYEREYRFEEAKQAYLEKLLPTSDAQTSKSSTRLRAR